MSVRVQKSRPALTELERRDAPVVGAFALPGVIDPGLAIFNTYSGVVQVVANKDGDVARTRGGTGGLVTVDDGNIYTSRVLTAAHVVTNKAGQLHNKSAAIYFDLQRGGEPVTVPVPFVSNAQHIAIAPGYTGAGDFDHDLAIVKLIDQSSSGSGGLLVQPFSATILTTPSGFANGQQIWYAGYGLTGIGKVTTTDLDGKKRFGTNRFELTSIGPWTKIYATDFDRQGHPENDAFGTLAGKSDLGFGSLETNQAPGDSGSPQLVDQGDKRRVVAVHVGSYRVITGNDNLPDVDAFTNDSFGEMGIACRLDWCYGDFIVPNVESKPDDVVLDMNYQVYGRTNLSDTGAVIPQTAADGSTGGVPDKLTVNVRRVGGDVEIRVGRNGSYSGDLNGTYYKVPASQIKSLTLRGTSDDETFVIEGPLGLPTGQVTIEGGGGNDTFVLDRHESTSPSKITLGNSELPGFNERVELVGQGLFVHTKDVSRIQINTTMAADTVEVNAVSGVVWRGVELLNFGGKDVVTVRNPSAGVDGPVFVNGQFAPSELRIDDSGTAGGGHYWLGEPTPGMVPSEAYVGPAFDFQFKYTGANGPSLGSILGLGVNGLTVTTTAGGDTFRIEKVPAALAANNGYGLKVNTLGGADTITVFDQGIGLGLTVAAQVSIDAGAAGEGNSLEVTDPTGVYAYTYSLTDDPIWDNRLNRVIDNKSKPGIFSRGIRTYGLTRPAGVTNFGVAATGTVETLNILTGPGADNVTIGTLAAGMSKVNAHVYADLGGSPGKSDRLTYEDRGDPTAGNHNYTFESDPAWDTRLSRANGGVNATGVFSRNADILQLNAATAAKDVVAVTSVSDKVAKLTIEAGDKDDEFTIGNGNKGLDEVRALLFLDGHGGRNTLTLNDAKSTFKAVQSTGSLFTRVPAVPYAPLPDIAFFSFPVLTYALAGGGGDFLLTGVGEHDEVTVAFDGGNDNLLTLRAGLHDPIFDNVNTLLIDNTTALHVSAGKAVTVGSLVVTSGGILEFGVGATAGRIVVTGDAPDAKVRVEAGTVRLVPDPAAFHPRGTILTLIENDTGTPIDGRFEGEDEDQIHFDDGFGYKLHYNVGTGDDLTAEVVNNAPTAAYRPFVYLHGGILYGSLAAGGHDQDGDPLTFGLVSGPAHGTLDVDEDGRFRYTPEPGYTGAYSAVVSVNDGNGGGVLAVLAFVPLAATDSGYTIAANSILQGNVLDHDADLNLGVQIGDVSLLAGPTHGCLAFGPDGGFLYQPDQDFTGTDTFTYQVKDADGNTATATVTVTVVNGQVQP